jgi:hypothetical protein
VAVVSGSGQSTTVAQGFASPLVALVTDTYGNPVPGASVSFAAPTSGASAALSGATATTDSDGQASVTAKADTVAGSYSVTASVAGVTTPASFGLTNTPGAPTSVAVVSGSGQSATVAQGFASPLVAVVEDPYGNPVPGVSVSFAAPSSGASAALSGATATTGLNGQASVTAKADTVAGSYSVTASAAGASSASFRLTNDPGAAASVAVVSGSNQSATVDGAFTHALVVVVEDTYGNPVPGASVTFAGPGSGASASLTGSPATTGDDGQASVTATANAIGGSYIVTASVTNVATPASFTLTNTYQTVAKFNQTKPNKSGSTIPIKIQVTDALGNNVGSSSLPVTAVSVIGPGGPAPLQSPGNSQPGNLFTFDPETGTYQFNLQTKGYKEGTYKLNFTVGNDPTTHFVTFTIG